jgi:hypothetical protein
MKQDQARRGAEQRWDDMDESRRQIGGGKSPNRKKCGAI